jgi:hypothetical protein
MDGLMKALLISLAIVFSACAKNEDTGAASAASLSDVKARAEVYQRLMGDPYSRVARCDGLTFIGLFDAATESVDTYKHEYTVNADGSKLYATGEIHRDREPCHVDGQAQNDSRSECSLENVLGFLHSMQSRGDTKAVRRVVAQAKSNNWSFCYGGDSGYTKLPQLQLLLNDWIAKLDGKAFLAEDADAIAQIKGFRGNVLGSYLTLKGRVFGYLRDYELEAVDELISAVPGSPLYRAIYHRFSDGDQSKAIKIMTGTNFPTDDLPNDEHRTFDWGETSEAMLYVWTYGLMRGI